MAEGPSVTTKKPVISSSPDDQVIRILLMGRNGSGKSSSGNTILGKKRLKVHKYKSKHESEVCGGQTRIRRKQVQVIDCPDLLDPDLNKKKLEKTKEQLISRCSAGLSAVLLTIPLEEPVENEEEILYYIKCLFGPEVQKYIMILFTHGDELEDLDETIDEYLQNKEHENLQQLVTECKGKFHCFNNKSKSDCQKQELLRKIEKMMVENRRKFIRKQMRRRSSMEVPGVMFSGKSSAEDPDESDAIPESRVEKDEIRLVLLGKTGSGKSATGNTIIGRNLFKTSDSSKSETKHCQSETRVRFGKEIAMIDTPGLYDTKLSEDEIKTKIGECITFTSPGPHAFIIVIRVGRFTEEEQNTVKKLKEVFGEQMEKYSMILFTHKKQLKQTIEQYIEEGEPALKELVESCGNRFFCLDNEFASFPQFKDLISKIETMVAENGHFSNEMFEEAEKCIQEIQKQKLNEKEKQLSQSEWQKIYWRLAEESRHEAKKSFSDSFMAELLMYPHVNVSDLRKRLEQVVTLEEKESTIKEAELKGFRHAVAVQLAISATRKLAKQKMCSVQ